MSKYTKSEKKQILLIVMCVLVYTVSYVSRYSYNANVVIIEELFGLPSKQTGLVGTFYFVAYGIGQVVHGLLCKRYNKKIIIPLVLLVSAIINVVIFLGVPFSAYKYLWFLNGIALSVLWPSLLNVLSSTLDAKLLDLSVTLMATPVALGTCIAYGSSALFNFLGDYKYSFLFGAIAPLVMTFIWFFSFNTLTENARVSAAAAKVKETAAVEKSQSSATKNGKKAVTAAILTLFILIGLFSVANNLIKDGLNTWVPNILKETYNFPASLSMILTFVLPIFGMAGAVFSVFMNRYVIKDFVLLDGLFYVLTALFLLLTIFSLMFKWSAVFIVIFFGMISLLAHSINCLHTSVAPLKMRESFNSGAVAGIFNGCSYAGSAISGYALGALYDASGWLNVFWLLFAISVVVVFLVLCYSAFNYINVKRQKNI